MAAARREERAGKGPIADDSEELQVDTSDDEPDADEGAGTIVLAGAAEAAGAAEVAITQVATQMVDAGTIVLAGAAQVAGAAEMVTQAVGMVRGRGRATGRVGGRGQGRAINAIYQAACDKVNAKRALGI